MRQQLRPGSSTGDGRGYAHARAIAWTGPLEQAELADRSRQMTEHRPIAARPAPPAMFAWLVHAFTAGGVVLALLALLAIEQQRWVEALAWLAVAGVVDGVDGALARWARVK